MMDGTLDANAEIRKKYITQSRGSASTFGNMIGQYNTIEELEAAQREARGDTGPPIATSAGVGQVETPTTGPHGNTVKTEDGRTYTWNPSTSKYE